MSRLNCEVGLGPPQLQKQSAKLPMLSWPVETCSTFPELASVSMGTADDVVGSVAGNGEEAISNEALGKRVGHLAHWGGGFAR